MYCEIKFTMFADGLYMYSSVYIYTYEFRYLPAFSIQAETAQAVNS